MMNLWDVHDMNVGDMMNKCTSLHNTSYKTHVIDRVIPYKTSYYNFGTTGYYSLCQVFGAINLTVGYPYLSHCN